MALLQISVVPVGTPTTSLSSYVTDIIKKCKRENLNYRLTDMGTIIEGKTDRVFSIARELHEIPFIDGMKRVLTTIIIDDRRDKEVGLDDKIKSVKSRL